MDYLFKALLIFFSLTVFWIQSTLDQKAGLFRSTEEVLYFPSGDVLKKLSLGHHGMLADVYWMRTVQYYGRKRLKEEKRFDLLQPLLEITTTLDPKLIHAYRFGSIFLSERQPVGADEPEAAIQLLRKGLQNNPEQWQLHRDIGFVYYWFIQDYRKAANAFLEGSKHPGAARWMKTFAAELLAKGGNRESARFMWQQIYDSSDNEQMKKNAAEHLLRLTADDEIDGLQKLVDALKDRLGTNISSLQQLVELGILQERPIDPKGFPYVIDPATGKVTFSADSNIRRY